MKAGWSHCFSGEKPSKLHKNKNQNYSRCWKQFVELIWKPIGIINSNMQWIFQNTYPFFQCVTKLTTIFLLSVTFSTNIIYNPWELNKYMVNMKKLVVNLLNLRCLSYVLISWLLLASCNLELVSYLGVWK